LCVKLSQHIKHFKRYIKNIAEGKNRTNDLSLESFKNSRMVVVEIHNSIEEKLKKKRLNLV
jgi:hypothetical protein